MLDVVEASGLCSLQDAGRLGWRRFGMPVSGPMDQFAHAAANLLLGNPQNAAVLEVGGGDLTLRATRDCVLAVTGPGFTVHAASWSYPSWGSYFLRAGWELCVTRGGTGMWAYVAVAGGFAVETSLGSGATYLRGHIGGLGGRTLQAGDELAGHTAVRNQIDLAGRSMDATALPRYASVPMVGITRGPQSDWFADGAFVLLTNSEFRVQSASDRMGYRLSGPALELKEKRELVSEGMTPGILQVPADGAPILAMADSATTGGYPKIACVSRADLPLVAQLRPGIDALRFHAISVEQAQAEYRERMARLNGAIIEG